MSILDFLRSIPDRFLMPHDGLYHQARQIVGLYDHDRNGVVDSARENELHRRTPWGSTVTARQGLVAADQLGDGDGRTSVREVRNLLKHYDVGTPLMPGSAGNGALEGTEWLLLLRDIGEKDAPGFIWHDQAPPPIPKDQAEPPSIPKQEPGG
jgi:hypothetical protein